MRQIRKSHTNEIIDRRLRECEVADRCEAMELIGLFDELARVERKWLENRKRIEAAMRKGVGDQAERQLFETLLQKLTSRTPVKV